MFYHSTALFCFALLGSAAAAVPAGVSGAGFGAIPVSFEQNQGQSDDSVLFLARRGAMTMYVTATGTVSAFNSSVIRMTLDGARTPRTARGLNRLPGVSHYYLGADPSRWRTGVPHFDRVEMAGVYPGVDLLYRGGKALEYDFVVAPGADPRSIGLRFEGGAVSLTEDGGLRIATAEGGLAHRRPSIYQTEGGRRTHVPGAFLIDNDGVVRFEVGEYRRDLPLIIDPVITYSTFLGGNGLDLVNGIVAINGEAVVAGTTTASGFPGSTGSRQSSDIFVARLNATGTALVYVAFIGGLGVEEGLDIAYDAVLNEMVVVGTTSSDDFPGTAGSFQSALSGSFDAVVTRLFANTGQLIRSTYYGGTAQDDGMRVAIDSGGGIVIAGNTISTNLPRNGATDETLDNSDVFLARFTQGLLVLEFGTYLGGSSLESVWALATDNAGNAYVGGTTFSVDFPVLSAFQGTANGTDGFITKFNVVTRNIVSSTYLGGSSNDSVKALAVDAAGAVYAAGETASTDFPTTAGAFDRTANGSLDIFAAKFNGAAMVWSSLVGGSRTDAAADLVLGPGNTVAIAGSSDSENFPTVAASQPAKGGLDDAVIFRLNAAGSALTDSTFLGASQREGSTGLAYGLSNSLLVAGNTDSFDFPLTAGALDTTFSGDTEGFVALFSDGPAAVPVTFQTNPAGAAVIVDGFQHTAPVTLQWVPGVTHSINVESLQRLAGNQTLTWTSWSGTPSNAQSQTIPTPASATTYTADFTALTCTYIVSPNPILVALSGGAFNINVTTQPGCPWTGSSNSAWISGGGARSGSGVVTFSAAQSPFARDGGVTVAFAEVPVRQEDQAPTVIGVEPASGTGFEQTFRFVFDDSRGANTLGILNVLINNAIDGRQACYLAIVPSGFASGTVILVNDAGDAGGPYAGTMALPGTATITNGNCAISGVGSSILENGTQLIVNLKVTFLAPFRGNRVIYMAARDQDSNNSGWAAKGVWTVPGSPASTPAVISLSPRSSDADGVTFTATFYDDLGPLHLDVLNILVNNAIDGRNACYIALVRNAATVVLVNDAGDAGGSFAGAINIPSLGFATNSQCTVDATGSSLVSNGRNLTLTLRFNWKLGFKGDRIVYLAARDIAGGNSGWQPLGVVSVP